MEILASIEWFISRKENTRLSSVESQPKKVVVVVGVVVGVAVVFIVVGLVIDGDGAVIILGHRNWVNDK